MITHSISTGNKSAFLPHIAGLRALAIILVVWFHLSENNNQMAEWARLPYGFYGVDVFIVIMGYLLIKGFVNKPEITFSQFAMRKLSRLYVPSAAAIVLTCVLSLFCLDADLLISMAKTGFSSLLGIANIQLKCSTAGYFARDASMNPFLHLWYLGVATQLFLLSYLTFLIVRKLNSKTRLCILVIIGIISFICSMLNPLQTLLQIIGFQYPSKLNIFSYYDTIPRIWVFLSGGLVFFLPELKNRKLSTVVIFASIAMVLIPACAKSTCSLAAISVVIGTTLIIRYTPHSHISFIFDNKAALWLGSISFSGYLIHVPLIVAYKGYFFHDVPTSHAVYILLISTVLSWGFYHVIEKRNPSKVGTICIWSGAIVVCLAFWFSEGFKRVWNVEANQLSIHKYPRPEPCVYPDIEKGLDPVIMPIHRDWYTRSGKDNKALPKYPIFQLGHAERQPSFVLIGDSHAEHYAPGFDVICKKHDISGVFLGSIILPLWNRELKTADSDYSFNRQKAQNLFHWLTNHPELQTVIIGQYWDKLHLCFSDWNQKKTSGSFEDNLQALQDFCSKLTEAEKKVIIIAPLPTINSKHVFFMRQMDETP